MSLNNGWQPVIPYCCYFLQTDNSELKITIIFQLFFRGRSRSKSKQLGTEPIVRFSFDNGDGESEFYKGLENPSYAASQKPHNEYQELMAQELSQDEDTVEAIAEFNDTYVQYDIVGRNLADAEEVNVHSDKNAQLIKSKNSQEE